MEENEEITDNVQEPQNVYEHPIKIFKSFEEQNDFERREMAKLSPIEVMTQMRQLINKAYGMKGYGPAIVPKERSIKIIYYNPEG